MTLVIFCLPSLSSHNNDWTSPLERESTVFPWVWNWQNSFLFDGPTRDGINFIIELAFQRFPTMAASDTTSIKLVYLTVDYAIKFLFWFADSYFAGQC